MSNAYTLLNAADIQPEDHAELGRLISAAKSVVENFYEDLRASAAKPMVYDTPFFLLSYDKLSFGVPRDIIYAHPKASATGAVGKFYSLDKMTSADALRLFEIEETEMKAALILFLLRLRQIEDEGPSTKAERRLDEEYERLKLFIGHCMALMLEAA